MSRADSRIGGMWSSGQSHRRARWLVVGAVAATGCARSAVTSTVKADGSWTRHVVFYAHAPEDNSFTAGPKLEEAFVLPTGGPWKTKREVNQTNHEVSYTAERSVQPEEVVRQDVSIRHKPDEGYMVNSATVHQLAPGKWEYRETLHWQGPLNLKLTKPDPTDVASIKAALPPELATDANAAELQKGLARELGAVMFGPPDPLLSHLFSEMLANQELAQHHMISRLAGPANKVLLAQFGDRMTAEQRKQVLHKLMSSTFSSTQTRLQAKSDPTAKKDDTGNLIALTFAVRLPGKITQTNGDLDELDNEVYWGLYPEAAGFGDITLTATCEADKQAMKAVTERVAAVRR